jgi:diguanylate cyclase (GGDEF)-like protein
MAAATTPRRLLFGAAVASYTAVFFCFLFLEVPGLGIAHFFYISIALLALATGPAIGALGGVAATALYAVGIALNPHIPTTDTLTISTPMRFITFSGIGALIGWFARNNRALVEKLQILAERDALTGLPNTRSFEAAITRRLDEKEPFGLLIGDVDGLKGINDVLGAAEGDDALRRLGELLGSSLGNQGEVARVGGDEFAVLVAARSTDELARLAAKLETILADQWARITFGWSLYPREGVNALSLYRAADERLYARKLIRKHTGGSAMQLDPEPSATD